MIDRGAVTVAAGFALAILIPPIVVVRVLLGNDEDSALWSVIPIAFAAAFVFGGMQAARRAPASPYTNAAAAGALAFGIALLGGVARNLIGGGSMSAAALISGLLFWQIAIALSLLGGFVANRRRSRSMEVNGT